MSGPNGGDFSEGGGARAVEPLVVPAAKAQRTQGGKGMDWRVWPGGPPGTGSGIGDLGCGRSESWGFYDRADQVDALLAYLNPQVEATPSSSTVCVCAPAHAVLRHARRVCINVCVVEPWQGLREGLLYEQLSLRYLKLTGNMRKKASEIAKAEREQVLHPPPCRKFLPEALFSPRVLCASRALSSVVSRTP